VGSELVQTIRVRFPAQLREERKHARAEVVRLTRRLEKLKNQRRKSLETHDDDLIDPELCQRAAPDQAASLGRRASNRRGAAAVG
jgi:hypothetical protein